MNQFIAHSKLTDADLWDLYRNGDAGAFAEIYRRHYRLLYNYGYKLVPVAVRVEDAIQELFIDLWRMRQTVAASVQLRFYLYRALRRKLVRMADAATCDIEDYRESPPQEPAYEQYLVSQQSEGELTLRLREMIEQLPLRQKEVIFLYYFESYPLSEVAHIMGISEKTARNMLGKALSKLREHRLSLLLFTLSFVTFLLAWLLN